MQITYGYSSFPDQVVPAAEKGTFDYGLRVGQAIEGDWFSGARTGIGNRFNSNYNNDSKKPNLVHKAVV